MTYIPARKRVREFDKETTLVDALTLLLDSPAYAEDQFKHTTLGDLKTWLGTATQTAEFLTLTAQEIPPDDPAEGKSVIWLTPEGIIKAKITKNAVTKEATMLEHEILT